MGVNVIGVRFFSGEIREVGVDVIGTRFFSDASEEVGVDTKEAILDLALEVRVDEVVVVVGAAEGDDGEVGGGGELVVDQLPVGV